MTVGAETIENELTNTAKHYIDLEERIKIHQKELDSLRDRREATVKEFDKLIDCKEQTVQMLYKMLDEYKDYMDKLEAE